MKEITIWCNCPGHGESSGMLMEQEEEYVEHGDPPGSEGGQIIFKCPGCGHRTFVRVVSQDDLDELVDALEEGEEEHEVEEICYFCGAKLREANLVHHPGVTYLECPNPDCKSNQPVQVE